MSRELNQYILKEYARLHSVMEQREFMEKVRFLMMAGEKEFSCYYSDACRSENFTLWRIRSTASTISGCCQAFCIRTGISCLKRFGSGRG